MAGTANAVLYTLRFNNADVSVQHLSHTIKFTYQSKCPWIIALNACAARKVQAVSSSTSLQLYIFLLNSVQLQFLYSSCPHFTEEALVGVLQSVAFILKNLGLISQIDEIIGC